MDRKINNLINKKIQNNKPFIKSIHFNNTYKNDNSLRTTINIDLDPNDFGPSSSLHELNSKWFINLTNKQIPNDVQLLLQLGDRFNLPLTNKKDTVFEVIKCLENCFEKIKKPERLSCRNEAVKTIDNIDSLTKLKITDVYC